MTEVLVASDIANGTLHIVLRDTVPRGYYLVTRPGVQRRPLKAFCRWLKTEARAASGPNVASAGV